MFPYGSLKYLYFITLNNSDGQIINSRYKSSQVCSYVWGIALNGDYLAANIEASPGLIVLVYLPSLLIIVKNYAFTYPYGLCVEKASGRFIVTGFNSPYGHISKFVPQSLDACPDYSTSTTTMNILPIGTDDVISETALTISSLSLHTVSSITYTNTTTTYSIVCTYISDVYFQTNSQSISVVENNNISISPLLPCSFSGTTSISYSIDKYNGESIPSWLTIDSNTGILKIISPEVSTDTIIHFYINSLVSGYSSLFQKIVNLNILNCVVQNCLQCSSNSNSICSTCISGYYLNSEVCVLNKSTVSSNQSLSIATQSIIGAAFIMIMFSSIINLSSISSLWSMLNQVQLFFFVKTPSMISSIELKH